MTTISEWLLKAFWAGFAKWAAVPGNDARAADFMAYIIENIVASVEASREEAPAA
jgi:hypothetical protein